MDQEHNIERDARSGRHVAFEKNANDIPDRESFERTCVAACGIEEKDSKEYETEPKRFLGYVMRQQQTENLCLTGKMERRMGRGRPKIKYLVSPT